MSAVQLDTLQSASESSLGDKGKGVQISRNVVDVTSAVSLVYLSSGNLLKPHTAWNGKRHAENLLTVRKEDNEAIQYSRV